MRTSAGPGARWRLPAALLACVLALTVATRADRIQHHNTHHRHAPLVVTAVSADSIAAAPRVDLHVVASGVPAALVDLDAGPATTHSASTTMSRTTAATPARAPPGRVRA